MNLRTLSSLVMGAAIFCVCPLLPADPALPRKDTAVTKDKIAADLEIARRIRRAILSDRTLSARARNVIVVPTEGSVILRGSVQSPQEKRSVEEKAAAVVGEANVHSELEVAAK